MARCVGTPVIVVFVFFCLIGAPIHAQRVRDVQALYAEVLSILTQPTSAVGPNYVAITFGVLGSERELQVQFALNMSDDCRLLIRYVPEGLDTVYQRMFDITRENPGISAQAASEIVPLAETIIPVECSGSLGSLMRSAGELSVPLHDTLPEGALVFHGLTYRIVARTRGVAITADVSSAGDAPVVRWLNALRDEVLTVLKRQEQQ